MTIRLQGWFVNHVTGMFKTMTGEEQSQVLDQVLSEIQCRHLLACKEARKTLSGFTLADEIARLTAQADQDTARAYEQLSASRARPRQN